jgi:hypothetical protein
LTVAGFSRVNSPLVAANALEANSRANPITRVFETVANFMVAPLFFPETFREWLGRPGSQLKEKTLVFPQESPTMLPLGLSAPAHKLALPLWGFSHLGRQTERERIPKPR